MKVFVSDKEYDLKPDTPISILQSLHNELKDTPAPLNKPVSQTVQERIQAVKNRMTINND